MGGVARKCDEDDPFLQERLINMPLRHSLFQPEHHFFFFLHTADTVQLNLCCNKKKKKAGFIGWNWV